MSKPTKITQVVTQDTLSTCANLSATIQADGRSLNLLGTDGPFITGGPRGATRGFLTLPAATAAFTADQIIDGFITIASGTNVMTGPSAEDIVKFVTSQNAKVSTTAFPNTGTVATPNAYWPTFPLTIATVGAATFAMGTGCLYYAVGLSGAGAADTGALVANSVNNYFVMITNATPGAYAVKIVRSSN